MLTGKVVRFDAGLKYGFIRPDNPRELPAGAGPDVFVHESGVAGEWIQAGDVVRFEVVPGRDGKFKSVNVRLIDDAADAPVKANGT
ncbi:MAG TPA: cold shock domain-containing protein [Xanthobacteraceae bacterium]|jgi:cold shock CspA family protein